MTEIVHLAGPCIAFDGVRRQRCVWCGALLAEYDLANVGRVLEPGEDPEAEWEPASWSGFVAVEQAGAATAYSAVAEPADGRAPERSCMRIAGDVTR